MAQSTGFKKNKTAIFISGRGSNLKSLIKFSKTKNSPISIDLIISDNELRFSLGVKSINRSKELPDYKEVTLQTLDIIKNIVNK